MVSIFLIILSFGEVALHPDGDLNASLGFLRENGAMAKAIALARTHVPAVPAADIARMVIVSGCALALILAGPALPY